MDQKILIFGSQGQLGHELTQLLSQQGRNVIAIDRGQLELTQRDRITEVISEVKPEIIINCAAYTAVDRAEQEPDLALAINKTAPETIAIAAQKINSYFIHISTDYVFDGTNSRPYREDDPPNPLGVYGKTKLAGEQAVRDYCDRALIIRTAWVYGQYGKGNFVKTMLRLGAEKDELRIVSDQIGSPTWTKDLAQAILTLLAQINPQMAGIYHYSNSGVCSWYDLAVAAIEEARQLGYPLKVKSIVPIATEDYPTPAQRPSYSVLSCQKISKLLGHHPPYWGASLKAMLGAFVNTNL
jgi:dTDP-4-dehydrorhamnose reductase